jgi:lipoprotein-anchoring transpeptidase ErfK/SrfK
MGAQTRSALRAFQKSCGLPQTGEADAESRRALLLDSPPLTTTVITEQQLARLRPLSRSWLGKSQQDTLAYESVIEMASELARSHPEVVRKLNPLLKWEAVKAGTVVRVPAALGNTPHSKAGSIRISLQRRELQAFDTRGSLLAHFPCSIARQVGKRPIGELRVEVVVPEPNYTFNPDRFPESVEARRIKRKLILPPGPNNPVGVAWIGLDKPGYGIHGTPSPERVGRAESHGCFRLANWNARLLQQLVWVGMPVIVEQ